MNDPLRDAGRSVYSRCSWHRRRQSRESTWGVNPNQAKTPRLGTGSLSGEKSTRAGCRGSARARTRASSGTEGSTHVRPAVRWPFMLSIVVAVSSIVTQQRRARKGRLRRPYRAEVPGRAGVDSLELSPRQPLPLNFLLGNLCPLNFLLGNLCPWISPSSITLLDERKKRTAVVHRPRLVCARRRPRLVFKPQDDLVPRRWQRRSGRPSPCISPGAEPHDVALKPRPAASSGEAGRQYQGIGSSSRGSVKMALSFAAHSWSASPGSSPGPSGSSPRAVCSR